MLTRRVIPCLDVDHGRVVKGVRFRELRDAGDPAGLAAAYAAEGADELVFLDISATPERRATAVPLAGRVARELSIPFTVGGGLRTLEDMRAVLHAGADRVALNTAAVREPDLVRRAAELFGSQAVVVAVDARRAGGDEAGSWPGGATGAGAPRRDAIVPGPRRREAPGPGPWTVRVRSGTREAGLDAVEWCRRAAGLGAGEILLTSMDRDGTREGYDVELIAAVTEAVPVPVVASGGAGRREDFLEAFEAGADAALAASLFHFGEIGIPDLKAWLADRGVPIRPASEARPPEGRSASGRREA